MRVFARCSHGACDARPVIAARDRIVTAAERQRGALSGHIPSPGWAGQIAGVSSIGHASCMGQLPTVATYLTYEELFGDRATRAELETLLRNLSLDDCLQTVGKLSSALTTNGMTQRAVDEMAADGLGPAKDQAKALIATGRPFVFPTRLSTLARVALDVAERRPADAFAAGADVDRFMRALLAVTDVFDIAGRFAVDDRKEVEDELARLMLRRLATRVDVPLPSQLVRYWRLFVDLPGRRPDLLVAGEDFDGRLQTQLGMPVRRYIAICFGLFVRFMTWNPKTKPEWTLDSGYWANTTISAKDAQVAIGAISATPDELIQMFRTQEAAGFDEIDDLRPFALHPLCEIEPGKVMPIEVDMLAPRLFGDGLYWRLHPGPRAPRNERSRYGSSVGNMLEEHLVELAQSVYPSPRGGAQRFWREKKYSRGDGPDLVIRDGARTVFIEVGGERVNTLKTLFQGDLESYDNDVSEIVVKHRVEQLDRKINDARAGRLRYDNREPEELGVIHPVVGLIDGFPIGPTLRERIDAAVNAAGYLQQPNLGRLEILSADELEALLGEVERSNATLSTLLNEFALDVEIRRWTMRDFLIARRGGLAETRFHQEQWKAVTGQLAAELFRSEQAPA